MKILKITCPNCGGMLDIDEEKKKNYCKYCGTPIFLDDEIKHVQVDFAEEAGYKFEKGRIKAQEEKIQEEREARIRKEQEAQRQREQKRQKRLAEDRLRQERYKNNGPKIAFIILSVFFAIIMLTVFLFCGGIGLFAKLMGSALGQGEYTNATTNMNENQLSKDIVTSFKTIDSGFVDELKAKADEEVENYINVNTINLNKIKETIEVDKYLGCCFGYDETNGNEIFFIYQIKDSNEPIDDVNLRKFTSERPIFYYVGFKNLVRKKDGFYEYDENNIDYPSVNLPDFIGKNIYSTTNYSYAHNGFPYISDLIDEVEGKYANLEYSSSKEDIIKAGHAETRDITFYCDYIGHCTVTNMGGYVDESNTEYNECIMPFMHPIYADPVCMDYRVGTEYNTLTITYGPRPGYYYDDSNVYVRVIDKDTFDVILETDKIAVGQSNTLDVDLTNHKNIRIQFIQEGSRVHYLLAKDVILSNKK